MSPPEAMDELPEPPEAPEELVEIEYNQPITSPYEHPIATVSIGRKTFGIPVYFLRKIPQLKQQLDSNPREDIVLVDVDEDIGHTFIHFLYTGQYETLDPRYDLARKYRRSALAYQAARQYELPGLEEHAKKYIKHFGFFVSLQVVLETAREIFPSLPDDEVWFKDYLKGYFADSFSGSRDFFHEEELVKAIGQSSRFDRFILQLTVGILFSRISELEETVERVSEPAPVPEPEPEPELDSAPYPAPESIPESESGPNPEPESETASVPELSSVAYSEPPFESEIILDAKPEPEKGIEPVPEPELEPMPEVGPVDANLTRRGLSSKNKKGKKKRPSLVKDKGAPEATPPQPDTVSWH
ncbi:hypothetical protein BJY04DRAFT_223528 [Aspergillus karnatakaensis]|uniref:uncharacterized protein n=1 Tax=Aspergillus karnatakaensis TaxID=1810916 RepID=UPI003CCD3C37